MLMNYDESIRACQHIDGWKFVTSFSVGGFEWLGFYDKNFDYPEKPLKYKHIRRISD